MSGKIGNMEILGKVLRGIKEKEKDTQNGNNSKKACDATIEKEQQLLQANESLKDLREQLEIQKQEADEAKRQLEAYKQESENIKQQLEAYRQESKETKHQLETHKKEAEMMIADTRQAAEKEIAKANEEVEKNRAIKKANIHVQAIIGKLFNSTGASPEEIIKFIGGIREKLVLTMSTVYNECVSFMNVLTTTEAFVFAALQMHNRVRVNTNRLNEAIALLNTQGVDAMLEYILKHEGSDPSEPLYTKVSVIECDNDSYKLKFIVPADNNGDISITIINLYLLSWYSGKNMLFSPDSLMSNEFITLMRLYAVQPGLYDVPTMIADMKKLDNESKERVKPAVADVAIMQDDVNSSPAKERDAKAVISAQHSKDDTNGGRRIKQSKKEEHDSRKRKKPIAAENQ